MTRTETATNDSSTESPSRPSRRKRWVAAASCVGLVTAIAGGGYWWHSTRVPNLTRVEAWTRYIELIEGGKYDEALSYSPYLQGPHDDGDSIEFLSDAAHAHAPSTISIEPVDNIDNPYSIEGHVSFNDGTDVSAPIVTFLSQKDKANGKLGWWHIEDPSFGTTISLLELDNRLFAFWGVGVVFEASRGLWTVSWDDDRTQELASGASSTKTRTQFGYPNFVQHPKTLQFQRCDFNV